jgi:hypothetical protein
VPQFNVELHGIAAQIDIAILKSHFLVGKHGFAWQERQLLRLIQDAQFFRNQFNFTCGYVLIHCVRVTLLDGSNHGNYVFIAKLFGLVVQSSVSFLIEDHLRDTSTVAQIDEDDAAQITTAVHPAH